jgi:hypothetical protein
LAILEPEAGIAGGGEAEKRIGPMADGKDFLSIERAHEFYFSGLVLRQNESAVASKKVKTPAMIEEFRFTYPIVGDSQQPPGAPLQR